MFLNIYISYLKLIKNNKLFINYTFKFLGAWFKLVEKASDLRDLARYTSPFFVIKSWLIWDEFSWVSSRRESCLLLCPSFYVPFSLIVSKDDISLWELLVKWMLLNFLWAVCFRVPLSPPAKLIDVLAILVNGTFCMSRSTSYFSDCFRLYFAVVSRSRCLYRAHSSPIITNFIL